MRHRKLKWGIAAICAALFALIALYLDALAPLDTFVYQLISGLHSPFATAFFQGCTALASPLALLIICFAVVFFMRSKEYRVPLMLNLILSVLLNLGIKNVFTRMRPTDVISLVVESGYSFPSGHTMTAACFYGFLIFLILRLGHSKLSRALSGFLLLLIALIGISRIYLGVHYASDVLAALCISVSYLLVYTSFVKKFVEHPSAAPKPFAQANGSLARSFSFAFEGVWAGLRSERNMVIHFGLMALVVVFGVLVQLTQREWIDCIFLFGLVFMAELFNTAIETIVDIILPNFDPRAKIAKDTSAGAVLAISIAAALIGVIIFLPKLLTILESAGISIMKR